MRRPTQVAVAVLLALAALLTSSAAASAQSGATGLLRDCQDDRITGTYSQAEYQQALSQLGTDAQEYSNCEAVIRTARLRAAAQTAQTRSGATAPAAGAQAPAPASGSAVAGGGSSSPGASAGSGTSSPSTTASTQAAAPTTTDDGEPAQVADASRARSQAQADAASAQAADAAEPGILPETAVPVSGAILDPAAQVAAEGTGSVDPGQVALVLGLLGLAALAVAGRQVRRAGGLRS